MAKSNISRREFLVWSGTTIGGAVLAGCARTEPTATPTSQPTPEPTTLPTQTPVPTATSAPKAEPTPVPPTNTPAPTEVVAKYREAPMLADMVAGGSLEPVDERLPSDAAVVEPIGSIGQYGGTLSNLIPDPQANAIGSEWFLGNSAARLSPDFAQIVPDILASWDLSEDYTELTCHLRKGMKWSDGVELTTDDVLFWYEDILLFEELTPAIDPKWAPGEQVMELEIADSYTFTLKFAVPHAPVIDYLTRASFWAPRHYLEQFHTRYNPDVAQAVQDEGFSEWPEYYQHHAGGERWEIGGGFEARRNLPVLAKWKFENEDETGSIRWTRNPYYWWIDAEGQQLPYADHLEKKVATNVEVLTTETLAGKGTHAWYYLTLTNYPLYKEYEAEGDYTVGLYPDVASSEFGYAFNYTHKDPVLREIFADLRWRMALSHAINRDEINELLFAGLGTPRQPIVDPSCTFFEEGVDTHYIEFDLDTANALLDEMGLEWDANHQWRLRPDGEQLKVMWEFFSGGPNFAEISELLQGYWREIGIEIVLQPQEWNFHVQRVLSGDADMACWNMAGTSERAIRETEPILLRPPWHYDWLYPMGGPGWRQWINTNGEEGVEPPEIVKHLWDISEQFIAEPFGTERYRELGLEMIRINGENIWLTGTVGLVQKPGIVKNTLRNAPNPGSYLSVDLRVWDPYRPEQWWFEEA